MTLSTADNVMSSGALNKYFERMAIRNYVPNLYFRQFAQLAKKKQGTNKNVRVKVDKMTGDAGNIIDGVTPVSSNINLRTVEPSYVQKGDRVSITDVLMEDAPVESIFQESGIELGNKLARTVDAYIQDILDAGTNVIYPGAHTERATVTATDVLTPTLIAKAVATLEAESAPKIDGYFVLVIHPHVKFDLASATAAGSRQDINKYTDQVSKIFKGEVGALLGARVILSPNVRYYTDGGASAVDVYPCYMFGQNAYGYADKVGEEGMVAKVRLPNNPTEGDELGQRGSASCKARVASAILKEEGLCRIEVASSMGANA